MMGEGVDVLAYLWLLSFPFIFIVRVLHCHGGPEALPSFWYGSFSISASQVPLVTEQFAELFALYHEPLLSLPLDSLIEEFPFQL